MFDRYSENGLEAMRIAREAARANGTPYIDDVHVLVGCCRAKSSVAARVLLGCGQDPVEVCARAAAHAAEIAGNHRDPEALPFSVAVKKTLELALDEATALGHSHLSTQDLLIGLLRNGGKAAELLTRGGLRLVDARKCVIELEAKARRR